MVVCPQFLWMEWPGSFCDTPLGNTFSKGFFSQSEETLYDHQENPCILLNRWKCLWCASRLKSASYCRTDKSVPIRTWSPRWRKYLSWKYHLRPIDRATRENHLGIHILNMRSKTCDRFRKNSHFSLSGSVRKLNRNRSYLCQIRSSDDINASGHPGIFDRWPISTQFSRTSSSLG
jgi:hypothetical protein